MLIEGEKRLRSRSYLPALKLSVSQFKPIQQEEEEKEI
jgi:hypothetical protein